MLDIQEFAAGFGHLSFQSRLDKVAELLPDSQDRVRLRALYQSVSNFEAHGSFAAVGKYISVAPLVFEATPVCGDPAAVLDVGVALLGFTWEIVVAYQQGSHKF